MTFRQAFLVADRRGQLPPGWSAGLSLDEVIAVVDHINTRTIERMKAEATITMEEKER